MYKYIKLQLLCADKKLRQETTALQQLARLFCLKLHIVDNRWHRKDTFLIELPENDSEACEVINVIWAYSYFHQVAHRLASEKVTVPFEKLLEHLGNLKDDTFA
jgi:hypothetical protein